MENVNSDGPDERKSYTFYNEDIWAEAKTVMNGQDNAFKLDSLNVEYGTISYKSITSTLNQNSKLNHIKL